MTQVCIFTVFVVGLLVGVRAAGECAARGRFPNEKQPGCRGYTMCIGGAPGVYTQLDLSCPENFVYSHVDNQCTNVTTYQCYPQHTCTDLGLYAADKTLNCTGYIACVHGLSEIATARLIQCPENTLYNPLQNACVNTMMFTCDVDAPPNLDALPSQESDNSNANSATNLCFKYALLFNFMFVLAV